MLELTRRPGIKFLAIMLMSTLSACEKPKPVLVLDSWWSRDYGKNNCVPARIPKGETYEACVSEVSLAYNDYNATLKSFFAQSSECQGVDFYDYNFADGNRDTAATMTGNEYFQLMINFLPDRDAQSWSVVRHGSSAVLDGEDLPSQLAKKVCLIAAGKGASMRD